jgi:hypothetical protein
MICGLWLISSSLDSTTKQSQCRERKNFSGGTSSAVRQLERAPRHLREKVFAKKEGAHLLKLNPAQRRSREMSNRTWLQLAMIVLPVGVLTASLGARSIGNTVELTGRSVRVEIPESAELFAAGTMLVGIATSAERVMRRKFGTA